MPSIEIPAPVITVSVETGKWRTVGNVPVANWEAVMFVMGNPVLARTYLDRDDAANYPEIAGDYDDTAYDHDDAEEKFGQEVAALFKRVLTNAHGHGPAA